MEKALVSKEQLEAIISQASDEIKGSVIADVKKKLAGEVEYVMWESIRDEIKGIVNKVFVPALREQITAGKEGLIKSAIEIAEQTGVLLRDAMIADFKEKLKQSWNRNKILEAMFK